MNLSKKQTHKEKTCGCKGKWEMGWEFGLSTCKLLYIGWINKVLLYGTGNYIQYPVINHNRKEYEKYITGSLCYSTDIKHNPVHQLYLIKFF